MVEWQIIRQHCSDVVFGATEIQDTTQVVHFQSLTYDRKTLCLHMQTSTFQDHSSMPINCVYDWCKGGLTWNRS